MTDFDDLELETALTTDPLVLAERLTGNSYKEGKATEAIGFGLHIENAKYKERLLAARDDTSFNTDFATQVRIMKELGFEVVLEDKFQSSWEHVPGPETYMVLWREDGVLATLESYGTTSRNTAKIYYNFQPNGVGHEASSLGARVMSSGKMIQPEMDYTSGKWEFEKDKRVVLIGDHDVREAVRFTLQKMEATGEFLPKWIERPWLWLLTYEESKAERDPSDYKYYEAFNEARIARLPKHVQEAITPQEG